MRPLPAILHPIQRSQRDPIAQHDIASHFFGEWPWDRSNGKNVLLRQPGCSASLAARNRPKSKVIIDVLAVCSPFQIIKTIIVMFAIAMKRFMPCWAGAFKCLEYQSMNEETLVLRWKACDAKGECEVVTSSMSLYGKAGIPPATPACIRYFIIWVARYLFPTFHAEIITSFAPAENDSEQYLEFVCAGLGLPPETPVAEALRIP